ncbi:MAG: hypothetical protein RI947_975 [Candidatus Parcubacteria bacterium]|jgi:hypothetical protein
MKKNLILAIALMSVVSTAGTVAVAQTKTLTPTVATSPTVPATTKTASPSAGVMEKEAETIKEKVENTVAKMRQKDRKAVAGVIITVKTASLTLKTSDDVDYEVKRDETLTKVYLVGTNKKEIKYADLKKGSFVIVTGPLLDKSIDANTIYQDEQFVVKSGKITEVNKDDYYIKIITPTKDTYTLDIENKTLMSMMDIKSLETAKVGFSKLKEGDIVDFVAKKTGTEQEVNRFSAEKLLIIPQEYFLK